MLREILQENNDKTSRGVKEGEHTMGEKKHLKLEVEKYRSRYKAVCITESEVDSCFGIMSVVI